MSGPQRTPSGRSRVVRVLVVRVLLGAVGVAVVGVGVIGALGELGPAQLLGLLGWLAAAVALHDGVLVPLTHTLGFPLRRMTRAWQSASAAVLRAGLVVGAVLGLIVLPLLRAQQLAARPSLLGGDYLLALGLVWLGIAAVVAVVVLGIERRARRVRPGSGVPLTRRSER